jgi:glycosyl transferase, family 25
MRFRDFFDQIRIINLAERTDRRAEMLIELEAAGLHPKTGRVEFQPACKFSDAAGFPNAGYHGCFRSHLGVLTRARDSGASSVLVIEDDLAIAPRFCTDEAALVEQLQSMPWGVVYFGHMLEAPADRPTRLRPHVGGARLLHFYAVNGTYLDRLVEFFEGIRTRPPGHPDGGPMSPDGALDVFLTRNPDVPCHVASPNLGTQRSSRSDLSPRWFDHVHALRGVVARLRRIKRRIKAGNPA